MVDLVDLVDLVDMVDMVDRLNLDRVDNMLILFKSPCRALCPFCACPCRVSAAHQSSQLLTTLTYLGSV